MRAVWYGPSMPLDAALLHAPAEQAGSQRAVAVGLAAELCGRATTRPPPPPLPRSKEARKAKLRETAGDIKDTGKDQQVFKDSE